MQTIRTIFFIIAFYYVFKVLARLFLPLLVKKVVEKAGENLKQQYQNGNFNNQSPLDKDQVSNNATKSDKPRENKKVGEYVDYEELD